MTSLLHRFPEADAFSARIQQAELDYLVSSKPRARRWPKSYVGLPY
ncbi:hypothetical protein ACTMU2_25520 [Cupriavidus basilensis]